MTELFDIVTRALGLITLLFIGGLLILGVLSWIETGWEYGQKLIDDIRSRRERR